METTLERTALNSKSNHAISCTIVMLPVHGTFKPKLPKLVMYPSFLVKAGNVRLFTVPRLAFSSLSDVMSVCMPYLAKITPITFQRHPTRASRTLRNRLASYLRVPVLSLSFFFFFSLDESRTLDISQPGREMNDSREGRLNIPIDFNNLWKRYVEIHVSSRIVSPLFKHDTLYTWWDKEETVYIYIYIYFFFLFQDRNVLLFSRG